MHIEPPLKEARILAMDDQGSVSDIVMRMLKVIGFDVETTCGGEEAVAAYQKAFKIGKPYDVVIMDLTVPGAMVGKEAIGKLVRIDPDVNAVVSSGYSDSPVTSNYEKYGCKAILQKPYRLEELKTRFTA